MRKLRTCVIYSSTEDAQALGVLVKVAGDASNKASKEKSTGIREQSKRDVQLVTDNASTPLVLYKRREGLRDR